MTNAPRDGLLVVDKPAGPTSHDVVARMRRTLGEKRIGHTGTLDPAASGVLPLVIGRATRLAQFLAGSDKEYEAVVSLGAATTTYDADGDLVGTPWTGPLPSREEIERALSAFLGRIEQQPPAYSAKKIGGIRSYRLARAAGRRGAADTEAASPSPPAPPPAVVTLHEAHIVAVDAERVTIRLACSAGFYVRSLAHDLGVRLGTGAHLAALRRTRSGEYGLDTAVTLAAAEGDRDAALAAILPMERLLTGWAAVVLTPEGTRRAANGCDLGAGDVDGAAAVHVAAHVRLLDQAGRLVGIGEPSRAPGLLHPAVVFV